MIGDFVVDDSLTSVSSINELLVVPISKGEKYDTIDNDKQNKNKNDGNSGNDNEIGSVGKEILNIENEIKEKNLIADITNKDNTKSIITNDSNNGENDTDKIVNSINDNNDNGNVMLSYNSYILNIQCIDIKDQLSCSLILSSDVISTLIDSIKNASNNKNDGNDNNNNNENTENDNNKPKINENKSQPFLFDSILQKQIFLFVCKRLDLFLSRKNKVMSIKYDDSIDINHDIIRNELINNHNNNGISGNDSNGETDLSKKSEDRKVLMFLNL